MPKSRLRRKIDNKIQEDAGGSNLILLKLENGKRYAHTAAHSYRLSMASLQPDDKRSPNCACSMINKGPKSKDENRVIIVVEHDLKENVLCVLDSDCQPQCKLDVFIQAGEQVAFRTIGKIPVQIIGVSIIQ